MDSSHKLQIYLIFSKVISHKIYFCLLPKFYRCCLENGILLHLSLQTTIFILGTTLLSSLKSKVVELASNANVLETIQRSAQGCLQVGWMVLLPTAEERARALSALLPNSVPANPDASGTLPNVPNGKRFMTDLLVSSLMADGGLEIALLAAIKIEVSKVLS